MTSKLNTLTEYSQTMSLALQKRTLNPSWWGEAGPFKTHRAFWFNQAESWKTPHALGKESWYEMSKLLRWYGEEGKKIIMSKLALADYMEVSQYRGTLDLSRQSICMEFSDLYVPGWESVVANKGYGGKMSIGIDDTDTGIPIYHTYLRNRENPFLVADFSLFQFLPGKPEFWVQRAKEQKFSGFVEPDYDTGLVMVAGDIRDYRRVFGLKHIEVIPSELSRPYNSYEAIFG